MQAHPHINVFLVSFNKEAVKSYFWWIFFLKNISLK